MGARMYPEAIAALQAGSIDWTSASIKALFLSSGFAFDPTKAYRDQIDETKVIATSNALTTPTVSATGVYSGDPFAFDALVDNRQVQQALIFEDTGDDAYSLLIAHYDSDCVVGVPFIPEGLEYFLYPQDGYGFFQIPDTFLVGPVSTYPLAGSLALGEIQGDLTPVIECPFVGTRLSVRAIICAPPSEVESCCKPTIRSSRCE